MRIPARPLIIALLAVVSYLPAAVAQDPNGVRIRPRIATAQPGTPTIKVTANKRRVPVGEEVTFTLSPANLVTNPRFKITLDFGDGTSEEIHQTEIIHTYGAPGDYWFSVLVKSPEDKPNPTPPVPRVSLSASPTSVEVKRSVNFTAQVSSPYPNLKYRFVFGDKAQTDWQDNPRTTHAYAATGTYLAYVDIGVLNKQIGGSERQPIQVTQPSPVTVDLVANPTSIEAGRVVTFNARAVSRDRNLKYRFAFGDGSPSSEWQDSPRTTHKYSAAGSYWAYVEVSGSSGAGLNAIATSKLQVIGVSSGSKPRPTPAATPASFPKPVATPSSSPSGTPSSSPNGSPSSLPNGSSSSSPDGSPPNGSGGTASPSNQASPTPTIAGPVGPSDDWWKYLLIALLVLFAGYQGWNYLVAPRPTFVPHLDPGTAQMGAEGGPLAMDFQINLNPNLGESESGIVTPETSFIKSKRSSDG